MRKLILHVTIFRITYLYLYTVYKIKVLMNYYFNKFLIGNNFKSYNLSMFIFNSNFYEMITDTELFAQ